MADENELPRIAQLLGVDPRADRKAFVSALDRELAQRDKTDPGARAQLEADDRLLDQAMRDGRITAASRARYRNGLRNDREGTTRVLAILAACPVIGASEAEIRRSRADQRPVSRQADGDADLAAALAKVTGRAVAELDDPPAATTVVRQIASEATRATGRHAVTNDELNAEIEADPEYHRGLWAIGVRDGLKPPPEQLTVFPDVDVPWDPKPELVVNADGTGHYEAREPDDKWLGTQGPRGESRSGRRT